MAYGSVYKIYTSESTEVYVGKTKDTLYNRLRGHRKNYRHHLKTGGSYTSSFEIIKHPCHRIELLKECDSYDDLRHYERYYIQTLNCVNRSIPFKVGQSMTDYFREYKRNNRERVSENDKRYYTNNRDRVLERSKKYRENNKDAITKYKKEYREANREKLSKASNEYHIKNRDKINAKNRKQRLWKNAAKELRAISV